MESKNKSKNEDQTDTWNKSLKCWRTSSTGPQCLSVETRTEIHLFPYGYLQHAKFSSEEGKDTIQIQFLDRVVLATGHGLKSLCDALVKFSVERIRICPAKFAEFEKNEGIIDEIQIQNRRKIASGKELES